MIALELDDKGFIKQMTGLMDLAKRPEGILKVMGREGSNQYRKHFLAKDRAEANKLAPGRRTHLWQRIAHSVGEANINAAAKQITIRISDPVIAQKVFGGVIRAKNAGALAIPENAEAYDRTPQVFEQETGLHLFLLKTGSRAFLAVKSEGIGAGVTIEYLLTPSVDQAPDPTALPPDAQVQKAMIEKGQKALDRQLKTGTPST